MEVWDAEEDLHDRTKVAAASQIFDACITRAIHLLQLHARLLDHLPLADPRPGFIVCVVPVFCLKGEKGSYIRNTFWEKQSLHLVLKAGENLTGKSIMVFKLHPTWKTPG